MLHVLTLLLFEAACHGPRRIVRIVCNVSRTQGAGWMRKDRSRRRVGVLWSKFKIHLLAAALADIIQIVEL